MMFRVIVACAGLSLGAAHSHAAVLDLPLSPSPLIAGTGTAFNDTGLFGFGFDLLGAASAPASAAGEEIVINGVIDGGSPLTGFFGVGGLTPLLDGTSLLGVEAEAVPGAGDRIGFLYANIGGSLAGSFGSRVVAIVTGDFGDDADAILTQGFGGFVDPVDVDVTFQAVVPLPSAAALALTGLAAFVVVWRRRGL